jgi:CheY-like chemotaxis protein
LARKILLADDSVTAQNMGRKILTDAGYEVITVNNGSAALKKITDHKPDLIVLDVYMPGYSGLEVCQRIKENRETARIPVLLTVGKLEPFKPEEARRARADAFVVKPFEASELLAALSKLEDKVIPQPEPYKQGRFAKAVASFDRDIEADKLADTDEGWKARLRIPTGPPKARDAEPDPDYAATQGKGFRDFVEPPARKSQPKAATEKDFERPVPAGVPHDITPEEIAALAAAAAQLSGAAPADAPPIAADKGDGKASGLGVEVKVHESAAAENTPVTFATAPEIPAVQSEEISSQVPVEEAPAPEVIQVADATQAMPEVESAAPAPMQPETIPTEIPSTPAEAVAPEPTQAESVLVVAESAAEAQAERELPPVVETSAAAVVPEPSEGPGPVSNDVPPVPEVAAWPDTSPSPAPPAAAADEEVMAALQALIPSSSGVDHVAPGNGVPKAELGPAAFAAAAGTADVAVARAHAAPRWIAEEVVLATEEAAVSLEREMEKAYATVTADGRPLAAVAIGEPTAAAQDGTAETTAGLAEKPTDQPVMSAMASAAAAAGEGVTVPRADAPHGLAGNESFAAQSTAISPTDGTPATPSEEMPEEIAEGAAAASETPVAPDTSIENEIVGGTDIMAANWKNIRDSIAGAAAKPAQAKEEFQEAETVKSEPEVAPVSATEKASVASATDPTAIASIVDSVLAELRPRIVEEIARKLADSKKE